jgi:hypothetical protein
VKQISKWSGLSAAAVLTTLAMLGTNVTPAMAHGDSRWSQGSNGGGYHGQDWNAGRNDPRATSRYGGRESGDRRNMRGGCSHGYGNDNGRQQGYNGWQGRGRNQQGAARRFRGNGQNGQNGRDGRRGGNGGGGGWNQGYGDSN